MAKKETQDTTTVADAQAGRPGFMFLLVGSAVKRKEDDKIVDYRFDAAKKVNGVMTTVAKMSNVEVPFAVTEEAAIADAADCTYTMTRLVDGQYIDVELKGVAAAVAIAKNGRPVESWRGRLRNGADEETVRKGLAAQHGFDSGDTPKKEVRVGETDLAAIMADETLSAADRLAKMTALLAGAGVTVK